jgi:hypothetical protein
VVRGAASYPRILSITVLAAGGLGALTAVSWWMPLGILALAVGLWVTVRWVTLLACRDPRALLVLGVVSALNRSVALAGPQQLENLILRLDDIALAIALLVLMVTRQSTPAVRTWTTTATFAGLGLFAVSGVVGGIHEGISPQPLALGTWLAVKFLVCAYVATRFTWTADQIRVAYRLFIALLCVVIMVAVVQLVNPEVVQAVFGTEQSVRLGTSVITSIFRVPGQYAVFTLLGLCVLLAAVPLTLAGSAGALIVGIAALLSLRLKALIDTVVVVAARAAMSPAAAVRRLAPLILVASSAAAAYLGSGLVNNRIGVLFGDAEASRRQVLYEVSSEIASTRAPVGSGFGSFGSEASISFYSPVYKEYGLNRVYGFNPQAPKYVYDASWATVLGEGGWLGLLGFAAALIALALFFWRRTKDLPEGLHRCSARAGLLFLTVYVADSLTTPGLFAGFTSLSLAILWSMAGSRVSDSATSVRLARSPARMRGRSHVAVGRSGFQ